MSVSLAQHLAKVFERRRGEGVRFAPGRSMQIGLETRTDPSAYHWHGLKRGQPSHPFVVAQLTLEGRGLYQDPTGRFEQTSGSIFLAIVPSDHLYTLPAGSASWSFFWLLTSHTHFVERALRRQRRLAASWSVGLNGAVFHRAAELFEAICEQRISDEYAWESMLLDWMCELDRAADHALYPARPRERLLARVREIVLSNPALAPDVETIAARFEMSRSAFSHHFRKVTGLSPSAYAIDVRLDRVRERLVRSDDPLKRIAADLGFADANHLCKVFRRHHPMSPGEFRRQMRGS